MGAKRKRNQDEELEYWRVSPKGMSKSLSPAASRPVQHSTLRLYYSHTTSLLQYLQLKLLSSASKARLRRLSAFGAGLTEPSARNGSPKRTRQDVIYDSDRLLRSLLNSTLVCYEPRSPLAENAALYNDYATFSQHSFSTTRSSIDEGTASQVEVSSIS